MTGSGRVTKHKKQVKIVLLGERRCEMVGAFIQFLGVRKPANGKEPAKAKSA